jgi:uncharacterized protein YndB with AHSA1/START domain
MTRQKSFKRVVRARMEKTGESYTAARAWLLAADEPKATDGPALSVSDEVIRDRTGRGWEEWFDLLDDWGAPGRPTTEVRRWLAEEHGIDGWGSAAVSITFERARGLRAVGEGPNGFTVTASKTVAVPVQRLYEAFSDEALREQWLPASELRERAATRAKSARFDWSDDGSRLNVFFSAKGDAKSVATLQHERLPAAEDAERMKAFWRDRVVALKEVLEG